ncbi:DUF6873 family GME fold protein [Alkalibacter saccharofermentans]|uniref:DUF6873 domain-containing protein n=1 Tax=Alkalibacter saccharofermentans DSM 14828 TaxID=1120975 RepID=A0A1M4UD26_9FIRM|nr:hypothetical protein [Alkalibacter saccharofermentans]SHE54574.1 hypothetical protein SAMN02746064_00724 [Alkalibacter saccharofermentans DSM 14828]
MKICLASEEIRRESRESILKLVDKLIFIKPLEDLYTAISSHGDIQVCPVGKNKIVVHPKIHHETLGSMKKAGLEVLTGQMELKGKYPENIYYNVGICGKYYFHKLSHTDSIVRAELAKENIKPVGVRQGYAKCSMISIGGSRAVTSDPVIGKKTLGLGIETLLVPPGGILLPGLDYGFIGGCCGVDESEKVVFLNGSTDKYLYGEELRAFIKKAGYDLVELHGGALEDIGSIFILEV